MEIFPDFQCNLVVSGSIQKKWLVRPGFSIFNGSQARIFVYRPVSGSFSQYFPRLLRIFGSCRPIFMYRPEFKRIDSWRDNFAEPL